MLPCSFIYYVVQHILDPISHSKPPAIRISNSHRNVLEFFFNIAAYTEATWLHKLTNVPLPELKITLNHNFF